MKIALVSPEANINILRLLILAQIAIRRLMQSNQSKEHEWGVQAEELSELLPRTLSFWLGKPVIRDVESDRFHIDVTVRATSLLDIIRQKSSDRSSCPKCQFEQELLASLNDAPFYLEGA